MDLFGIFDLDLRRSFDEYPLSRTSSLTSSCKAALHASKMGALELLETERACCIVSRIGSNPSWHITLTLGSLGDSGLRERCLARRGMRSRMGLDLLLILATDLARCTDSIVRCRLAHLSCS